MIARLRTRRSLSSIWDRCRDKRKSKKKKKEKREEEEVGGKKPAGWLVVLTVGGWVGDWNPASRSIKSIKY